MKPVARKDGRWRVRIPAKLSKSHKRESRYFATKSQAQKFISTFKTEQIEHGKSGVSANDRQWIGYLRQHVGDLRQLPAIVEHWRRTGENLDAIETRKAVETYTSKQSATTPILER
jgi:hypothetical protein